MKRWFTVFGGIVMAVATADAAQIMGRVTEATGNAVTVKVQGAVVPAPGDQVQIFFTLAGSGDEVSVATGQVEKVEGDTIRVKVVAATGEVEKDQLVRFTPGQGTPKIATTSSPTATPAVFPSPIPVTTPDVGTLSALRKKSLPPSPPSPTPKSQGKAMARPSPSPTPDAQVKKPFAGKWRVLNENPSYTLMLSQNGNKVSGTYDLQNGSLKGEVQGDILTATWRQTGNRASGWLRLKLSDNGEILSGPWDYDATANALGFHGGGNWTLRRLDGPR